MKFEPDRRPHARRILLGDEMQHADAHAIDTLGVPGVALMENAGRAVAEAAHELAPTGRLAVVCGRGNNGGDGLVAARHLVGYGRSVDVILCAAPDGLRGDAGTNFETIRAMGVPMIRAEEPETFGRLPAPGHYALIVDAVLGTGIRGAVRGTAREAIAWIKGHGAPVLAVDVPSGLCADTGQALGAAVTATMTVTFAASKLGQWLYPGPAYVGRLRVVDIGMPGEALEKHGRPRHVLGDDDLRRAFQSRAWEAHKGTLGHLYVLGGSVGRTGAVRMALDAALRAGVGLVTLGTHERALPLVSGALYESMSEAALVDSESPVSTAERLATTINDYSALVVGPGMPTSSHAGQVVVELMPRLQVPVVVDADALNHLSRKPDALTVGGPKVLTPHPGEAGRLLGMTSAEVQADRASAVEALARRFSAVAVLKGAHTLVCAPDGRLGLCPDGNPGMATAGMGDVLAGIIGALLARKLDPFAAACAGVVWHARAGDHVAARRTQNALVARDVVAALADVERACSRG